MNTFKLIILAIILISILGFFILKNQPTSSPAQLQPSPTLPSTVPTQTDLGSGSLYRDTNGIYTFRYPDDYILDTADPVHIRIYKRGDTQRPQSEMSDGALMVFETIELQGTSLESWVDIQINQSTADGTSEIIEPKRSITQNGYLGFQYSIRGLGTSQNIILQRDTSSRYAVIITYAVSDPENRGYQKELEAVLSSFTLIK